MSQIGPLIRFRIIKEEFEHAVKNNPIFGLNEDVVSAVLEKL